MKMMKNTRVLAVLLSAGLATPVLAQDSTSANFDGGNGLPGDAVSPWTTGASGYQKTAYVVDLAPLTTSWGQRLGIAPIIKTSKTSSLFFSSQFSPSGISATVATGAGPASPTYELWTAAPGRGINREENHRDLISVVPGPASGARFGVAVAEFATDNFGFNVNQLIGGLVNVDPAQPERLFVQRVVVATNNSPGVGDSSQLGFGAVDSNGNVYFRADAFGAVGPNQVTGDNLYRVNIAARNTNSANLIAAGGGSDAPATAWMLQSYTAARVNCPTAIPAQISPPGVILSTNFLGGYFHGSTPPATEVPGGAHRPGTTDHRGNMHYYPGDLLAAGGAGTAGMLTIVGGNSNTITLWPVTASGAPISAAARNLTLPASISDPASNFPFSIAIPGPGTPNRFDHYGSQTAARGNSPISIGRGRDGAGLAAGVVYDRSTGFGLVSPTNAVAVARFRPAGPTEWVIAAWTNDQGLGSFPSTDLTRGKEILGDGGNDGVIGTGDPGDSDGILDLNPLSPTYDAPIGRLASTRERNIAGIVGPSIGGVSFDAHGNLYFLASVVLKKFNRTTQQYFDDYDAALIRANYDPVTFSYRLELLLEQGNVFTGQNSGNRYQIRFLEVQDSNSVGSGTTWGNSAAPWAFAGLNPAELDPRDPRVLGGVVVNANIIYDVGDEFGGNIPDGRFNDPTGASSTPDSRDEAYNVVLYIGYAGGAAPPCPGTGAGACSRADWNEDGVIDFNDFLAFLNDFNAEDPCADLNGDGVVDFNDFLEYLNIYNVGC